MGTIALEVLNGQIFVKDPTNILSFKQKILYFRDLRKTKDAS